VSSDFDRKQVRYSGSLTPYRIRGHQRATLDPLGLMERAQVPDLELGFMIYQRLIWIPSFRLGMQNFSMPEGQLSDIIRRLRENLLRISRR
jgi:2-oxoglutarate dehydrogenase E1 component